MAELPAHNAVRMPDISNLASCIEDVRLAALDSRAGPPDPVLYYPLLWWLSLAQYRIPPTYREAVLLPFAKGLTELGPIGFQSILAQDPQRLSVAGLMLDVAQALLQHGVGYEALATDAFQEVVSDLYDGFLSAEDRGSIKPPDYGVIAPLVKWGRPNDGPYTWPADATRNFGANAAVVNLPPANARRGLLAWAALAHETCGHDILHADIGLVGELATAVEDALRTSGIDGIIPRYWSLRIDETASDVLGILNMGPIAAIGLIGYFRGLNAAFAGKPVLRNEGADDDPHPADILRGFLATETVRLLLFDGSQIWSDLLAAEVERDVTEIILSGQRVESEVAKHSAKVVATTLVSIKAKSLEHHSLGEIQNWRNADEERVDALRRLLVADGFLPQKPGPGFYAAHAVAATVLEALSKDANLSALFPGMLGVLKTMHEANPSWGALRVAYPSNVWRRFARVPIQPTYA